MIEKLNLEKRYSFGTVAWLENTNEPSGAKLIEQKVNQLVDAINNQQIQLNNHKCHLLDLHSRISALDDPTYHEAEPEPTENVQDDHYWFKQQERYKVALVLIRDLTGGGMSYHDIVIEMREIAKWALDPNHQPLLIGRYNKEASELLDVLRETKGGDNE